MFDRTTPTKIFAPRRPRMKIRNPKHEILNKPKHSNLKFEIQNDLGKNPKSEYQNTKQFQNLNSQNPKPSNKDSSCVFKCFEISILSFPFLFRISDFEFRICNLIYTWRPLRLRARPVDYPFHRSVIFSFTALFHRASHLFPR